jgi:hypothetical protein
MLMSKIKQVMGHSVVEVHSAAEVKASQDLKVFMTSSEVGLVRAEEEVTHSATFLRSSKSSSVKVDLAVNKEDLVGVNNKLRDKTL